MPNAAGECNSRVAGRIDTRVAQHVWISPPSANGSGLRGTCGSPSRDIGPQDSQVFRMFATAKRQ
jgi:hypothetical protein